MRFDSRSYRHSIYLDQPGRSTKPADRQVLALPFELIFLTSIPAATASDMYVFASLFKNIPAETVRRYSTGRWATGSPFISTQGSADTSCLGLVTTSSNGTAPNGVPQTAPSHSMSRSRIATIAGASAGALLLVFAIVVALVLRHRRLQRSQPKTTEVDPFFSPRQTSTWFDSSTSSGSRATSKAESRRTAETDASQRSPSGLVVRELPPPYPHFLQYDHGS
jgi:hypothetical protein